MRTRRFRLGDTWCKLMHPAPMWPVKGQYQCPTCLRSYRVPWEQAPPVPAARAEVISKASAASVNARATAVAAAMSR